MLLTSDLIERLQWRVLSERETSLGSDSLLASFLINEIPLKSFQSLTLFDQPKHDPAV